MTTTAITSHFDLSRTRQSKFEDLKPIATTIVDIESIVEAEHNNSPSQNIEQTENRHDDTPQGQTGSLISASLLTDNFDVLRFDAAASLQVLPANAPLSSYYPTSNHLISSPYNDPEHLLDLRTLDIQCRLLSQALTFLKPTRTDYATADYLASFNWSKVLSVLQTLAAAEGHKWASQSFYTVIFRSELNKGIDLQLLHDLDKTSHREAVVSGQLLKYWFGKRNEHERNLATCVYQYR
jgi:hypothetical protein